MRSGVTLDALALLTACNGRGILTSGFVGLIRISKVVLSHYKTARRYKDSPSLGMFEISSVRLQTYFM